MVWPIMVKNREAMETKIWRVFKKKAMRSVWEETQIYDNFFEDKYY